MPKAHLGRKDEPALVLEVSPDLLAVRTHDKSPLARPKGNVALPLPIDIDRSQLVISFPEAGVEVYRLPSGHLQEINTLKRDIHDLPDIRFAGRVLVDPISKEPVLYTENIFVKFKDRIDPAACEAMISEFGLDLRERLSYADNAYFVSAPEGTGQKVFDIAEQLLEREEVEYCHPELVRERTLKTIPPQQWHLAQATINGVLVDAHANVGAAHDITRGEGITIAIIDDGIDIDHLEFSSNGKITGAKDMMSGMDDPRPKYSGDNHGTACAGVACASGMDKAIGVAPQARLMPIRLAAALGSKKEADAFTWAADNDADIISCSWGPSDGKWWDANDPTHSQRVPMGAMTKLAIDYATQKGRGGRGCIILFAAGNGNESVDNDGYASYEKVIAVAACNDRGKRSVYSDYGNAIWCSFPSSDMGYAPLNQPAPLTPGIWTTDRKGRQGYNPGENTKGGIDGNYTNSFGGTSSACPGAAGVAALILSIAPQLLWHQVRDLMKRACDKIDVESGAYKANGHSIYYGFGRLNAATAVQLARSAREVAPGNEGDFL